MFMDDFLTFHARERPDVPLVIHRDRVLTYRQGFLETCRQAQALVRTGLQPGDRIVVLARTSVEYFLLYRAASMAGAVMVPLNHFLPPTALAQLLTDAQPRMIFATHDLCGTVDELRPQLTGADTFVLMDADEAPGWIGYRSFVERGVDQPPPRTISKQSPFLHQYTSGTTGVPKAVVISHEATMNGIIQLDCYFRPRHGEKWLITLPGFVGLGMVLLGGLAVMSGGTMLVHDGFDPEVVVRTLDEEGIALTALVPLMIERMLAVPGVDRRRYESLRAVMYTTAPMSPDTLTRAMEVFRCGFFGGYGMTELGNITMQEPNELRRWVTERPSRLASVGRPHPGTELRIADPDGHPLPAGQPGEVLVKGPGRMAGYWNRPEATAAVVRDGWLRTGDLGHLDEDGYLYVHDRLVNLVNTSAGRVIPREVEVVLLQHPAIAEAAVIGQPDGEGYQAVKAVVVLRPGASASADEIIQFCAARLPPHAVPRSVEYVDALPRNFFFKVEKGILRARFVGPDACDVAGC